MQIVFYNVHIWKDFIMHLAKCILGKQFIGFRLKGGWSFSFKMEFNKEVQKQFTMQCLSSRSHQSWLQKE